MTTPPTAMTTRPSMTGWLGFSQPLEQRVREPLAGHLQDVATVASVFEPPAEWSAASRRWEQYLALSNPCLDQLSAALATGVADIPISTLRALALAELGTPSAESDLRSLLVDGIHLTLCQLWQPVAATAYKACSATFDSAAAVGDDAQLDQAAAALVAAARLTSPEVDQNVADWSIQRLTLGLTVDPRKAHIRRVATAFSTRADRWAAVRELGGELRAAKDPATTYPSLPAYLTVVDRNRVITSWDPLDGNLPEGWQSVIDGWVGS